MFKKAITLFAAGAMMACMFAGTGSMGVMAAEKITEAKAKEIALEDAGLSSDEVMFERIEKGTENGASVYEIEFETASEEFDYDIAKAGGKILNASRKVKVPACVTAQEKSNGTNKSGKTGREAAIDAALAHAGLSVNEISGLRCEKDYDDGREIYDVEFRKGGYEYSYDIDAHTYSVLDWDKDYDD
jgi:uncharacterized membrane protein YkoI